ncbi:MAG: SMP-30/gluconolactonase/LRE family protein [Dongiaceae bacterium]
MAQGTAIATLWTFPRWYDYYTEMVDCILRAENSLGEGPRWSVGDQCLWWVDIRAPALLRFDPERGATEQHDMPAVAGAVAPCRSGRLLVALKGGLAFYDPFARRSTPFAKIEHEEDDLRPNEGRCDPQGRFWLGTMVDLARYTGGSLYRIDSNGDVATIMGAIGVPNSLAWSPDGQTMYFSDSSTGEIGAFDFDPVEGGISNRRILAAADIAPGVPDGSTVDADGCLWNVRYGAGLVIRIAPDGRLDRTITLPVSQATACTFGGSRLEMLFITSAKQRMTSEALKAEPLAGGLFALEAGVSGIPETLFDG